MAAACFHTCITHTGAPASQATAALLAVRSDSDRQSFGYLSWLARCHVLAGAPDAAWALYVALDPGRGGDSRALLEVLADEGYGMGHFLLAAKAFQARHRRLQLSMCWSRACAHRQKVAVLG